MKATIRRQFGRCRDREVQLPIGPPIGWKALEAIETMKVAPGLASGCAAQADSATAYRRPEPH
jgi:hypothetical protein